MYYGRADLYNIMPRMNTGWWLGSDISMSPFHSAKTKTNDKIQNSDEEQHVHTGSKNWSQVTNQIQQLPGFTGKTCTHYLEKPEPLNGFITTKWWQEKHIWTSCDCALQNCQCQVNQNKVLPVMGNQGHTTRNAMYTYMQNLESGKTNYYGRLY